MELEVRDFTTEINILDSEKFSVSDEIFKCPFNQALIHQVISTYLTNSRQGTRSQKSRSEVSGSNKKPWRQKGTGRARSGSVKSPIWRSGGVTFAAKPKLYAQKINKKMYRGAIRSILSKLVCDNRLFLVRNLFIKEPKTKLLLEKLRTITSKKSILIFTDFLDKNLLLASRNVHKIEVRTATHIDPVSLINFNVTLIADNVIKKIEKQLV
ncbi:50S ribosomal subunit protein L4 [Candidatus Blochmanniella pennsylvanica str. BPEN]|uniref:Large ribosomal subunit protein uL4 n=1 Tax=Blochmanniella pennsylvanica (strain BPEN) TaxID=291272 RepID=RL4_BLOPB|nr:50S ribosomal protein L4 [Candidatus Blochmannia pennsylvanicus]Q493K7.1 RecName: Full=Large ribosomal subunit protein uL4; AltName: Full=50S ribosomal protein L4 [Candidatus Blochmannia pennsylvanicus str. BPEN]AAZ40833.1 50S ribosomal subunit protein L4 [Candidatus Blochmannia pennsylvanicus str. BPEN]UOY04605.1 50S ribosomal protein L4 [Candidatus Blochmannia pennsylvanicus]